MYKMYSVLLVTNFPQWQNIYKPSLEAVIGIGNAVIAYSMEDALGILDRDYSAAIVDTDMPPVSGQPIQQGIGLELADRIKDSWKSYEKISIFGDREDFLIEALRRGIKRAYIKQKRTEEAKKAGIKNWNQLVPDLKAAKLICR